jgi:hypothetical protein
MGDTPVKPPKKKKSFKLINLISWIWKKKK